MSEDERRAVVEALPAYIPWEELRPPEGDLHMEAKTDALGTLRTFFASTGRRVYVSSELGVYYPDEPRFAPDLLAVCDVEPHRREKWVVSAENKGLDFVVEVHVKGSSKKDLEKNVERYARLGIPEYFIYDRRRQQLRGFRLPSPDARRYQAIEPVAGKLPARTLGLDLVLEGGRLRFYVGNACLLDASELVERLGKLVAEIESNADARIREIEERAAAEAERAAALEERLAEYERRFGPLR